jgi:hypothetical protein
MSFEDRIRAALGTTGRAYEPGPPPVDELAANLERRRRIKLGAAGGAFVVAVALVIGGVALTNDPSSNDNLTAAGDPTGTTAIADGGEPSTTVPGPATSAATIPPSGTAVAPPASVVHPPPTTRPAPAATTTTAPAPADDTVTVTAADNGKTFTLRRGQHLVVSLSESGWIWSDPDTDNAAVLKRTAVSANPSSDHVTASFDALTAGQAHVSASKDAPCRQSQPPCMVPTYLWQVTINVV